MAWAAGIVYVLALAAVSVIRLLGGGLSQSDSAATIAGCHPDLTAHCKCYDTSPRKT